MKLDQANASTLTALLAFLPEGATHYKVTPEGKTRPTYEETIEMKALHDADDFTMVCQGDCTVFPARKEGSAWVQMEWVNLPAAKKTPAKKTPAKEAATKQAPAKKAAKVPAKKTPAKKVPVMNSPATKKPAKKAPAVKVPAKKEAAKKTAKAKEKKEPRVNTGFVDLIRKLLDTGKNTIQTAADAIVAKFPDKDERSVKRICYNLARKEGKKWKAIAVNTGYLNRIDELLELGENTTRQIGEIVSIEFEKPLESAKAVVRARLQVRTGLGHKLKVPHEDVDTRLVTYLPE